MTQNRKKVHLMQGECCQRQLILADSPVCGSKSQTFLILGFGTEQQDSTKNSISHRDRKSIPQSDIGLKNTRYQQFKNQEDYISKGVTRSLIRKHNYKWLCMLSSSILLVYIYTCGCSTCKVSSENRGPV